MSVSSLFFITIALSAVMLLALRSLARHGVGGVRAWSQANAVAIAALLLFMGRGALPDLLSIEAANLLFLSAPAMMYAGFLRHLGRPVPRRRLCAGVGVSIGLLALVHHASDSAAPRIALTSASHAVVYALILVCLAGRARFAGATYPQRFSAGVALLLMAVHAARALIYTAMHDSAATIFDESALNLVFFTLGTLALPALTLGAVMMANDAVIRRATWAAEHDHLTGAWSRRAFFSLAEREHERTRRSGCPLSVLVFDVDHFKAINDTHGHAAGDAVLADIVLRAEAAIRSLDACARLGGEEFAVLLPDTGPDTARLVAGRLRAALDQSAGGLRYTVSIGVASLAADESLSALLERADAALYAAKAGGRNRVCDAAPAPAPALAVVQ